MSRFVQTIGAAAPAGAQAPFNPDWMQSPFNVSWKVDGLGATTGTYAVEYTLDDVNTVTVPTWMPVYPQPLTANGTGQLTSPVQFLRVNFTTGPVGGACTFTVIQGQTSR